MQINESIAAFPWRLYGSEGIGKCEGLVLQLVTGKESRSIRHRCATAICSKPGHVEDPIRDYFFWITTSR
jgi:hypothetical protein